MSPDFAFEWAEDEQGESSQGHDGPADTSAYALLNLPRTASFDQIKARWKELSVLHPDKRIKPSSSASASSAPAPGLDIFLLVRQAVDILSNPPLRRIYDKFGMAGVNYLRDTSVSLNLHSPKAIDRLIAEALADPASRHSNLAYNHEAAEVPTTVTETQAGMLYFVMPQLFATAQPKRRGKQRRGSPAQLPASSTMLGLLPNLYQSPQHFLSTCSNQIDYTWGTPASGPQTMGQQTVSLRGEVEVRKMTDEYKPNVVASYMRELSSLNSVELSATASEEPELALIGTRKLSTLMNADVGFTYSLVGLGLQSTLNRQMGKRTAFSLAYKGDLQKSALTVGLNHVPAPGSWGSLGLQEGKKVGVMSYNAGLKLDHMGLITLTMKATRSVGFHTSVYVESRNSVSPPLAIFSSLPRSMTLSFGLTHQFLSRCRLSLQTGLTLTAAAEGGPNTLGVQVLMRFQRGTEESWVLPLTLQDAPTLATRLSLVLTASVLPFAFFCVGKYALEANARRIKRTKLQQESSKAGKRILALYSKAMRQQNGLRGEYARVQKAEGPEGLLILDAMYECDRLEIDKHTDFPHCLPARMPLQVLVRNGRLLIPTGTSKAGLYGLVDLSSAAVGVMGDVDEEAADMAPLSNDSVQDSNWRANQNQLHILYSYRRKHYRVSVQDGELLDLPNPNHESVSMDTV